MKLSCLFLPVFVLLAGCALHPADKTPKTRVGQLNSCMQEEVYRRHEAGALNSPDLNAERLAREILSLCRSRLNIDSSEFNAVQSLAIVTSTIRSLR